MNGKAIGDAAKAAGQAIKKVAQNPVVKEAAKAAALAAGTVILQGTLGKGKR